MNIPIECKFRQGLPVRHDPWSGFPKYNFVGGHNDREGIPINELVASAESAIGKKGRNLATYFMDDGPQGLSELRSFIADRMQRDRGFDCSPDQVLITSGSIQGLHLINSLFLEPGDVVIVEEHSFNYMIKMIRAKGARIVAAPMDSQGLKIDALEKLVDQLDREGTPPKFIYSISTIQNPTGSILPLDRRRALVSLAQERSIPIIDDECYSDFVWGADRPPALRAFDEAGATIHVGSFSKSLAPAFRLGYLVVDWPTMGHFLALKLDGGTSALEQAVVADFFTRCFDEHVTSLNRRLKEKQECLINALTRAFGSTARFSRPEGGMFLWVRLPDAVDTSALAKAAQLEGIAIDPGADFAVTPNGGRHHLRLCFALPTKQEIIEGVSKLAEICRRETGVPN